ncbi:MAG: hypothetical protein KGJ13_11685 [Patescibacteria group bacterium]|nr:hypothetical protein [Patescibacteria group bacterium]
MKFEFRFENCAAEVAGIFDEIPVNYGNLDCFIIGTNVGPYYAFVEEGIVRIPKRFGLPAVLTSKNGNRKFERGDSVKYRNIDMLGRSAWGSFDDFVEAYYVYQLQPGDKV